MLKVRVEETRAAGLLRRKGEKRDGSRIRQSASRADEVAFGPSHRLRAAAAGRMAADRHLAGVDLAAQRRRRCQTIEFVQHRTNVVRPIPVEIAEEPAGRRVHADRLAQQLAARFVAGRVSDADAEVAGARAQLAPLGHAGRRVALAVAAAMRPDDHRHRQRCAQRLTDQQLDLARLAGVVGVENAALEGREAVARGWQVQAARARRLVAVLRLREGRGRLCDHDDRSNERATKGAQGNEANCVRGEVHDMHLR